MTVKGPVLLDIVVIPDLFFCSEQCQNIYLFFVFPPVEFDDCAGNENATFDVSDPSFYVDADLNLAPQRDVVDSQPVLFVHGVSAHADEIAQVEITGLPLRVNTLRVSITFWFADLA